MNIMKAKFYICRHCGSLMGMINDSGISVVYCGQKMEHLMPNTVEASGGKHLPVGRCRQKTALRAKIKALRDQLDTLKTDSLEMGQMGEGLLQSANTIHLHAALSEEEAQFPEKNRPRSSEPVK